MASRVSVYTSVQGGGGRIFGRLVRATRGGRAPVCLGDEGSMPAALHTLNSRTGLSRCMCMGPLERALSPNGEAGPGLEAAFLGFRRQVMAATDDPQHERLGR
jgi:hypothetical protein